jgi:DNA-directed RNA polymerase specialized sigma24 family protein
MAYAYRLYLTAGLLSEQVLRPYGKSPEDYVQEVLTRLWDESDTGVNWNTARGKPTTQGVIAFLKKVLLNDFIDDRRERSQHRRTQGLTPATADDGADALDPPDSRQPSQEVLVDKVHRDRLFEQLFESASGDEPLEEYLLLQCGDDGYNGYTPARAAELLNTTVDDIQNRKRKCSRLLERFLEAQAPARTDMGQAEGSNDEQKGRSQ